MELPSSEMELFQDLIGSTAVSIIYLACVVSSTLLAAQPWRARSPSYRKKLVFIAGYGPIRHMAERPNELLKMPKLFDSYERAHKIE